MPLLPVTPRAVVETHCGIVRGGYKLACKASPAGAELRQINALAVGKFMLKNPEVRKAQIENRRRVKGVSISEDSRVSIEPRVTLAVRLASPRHHRDRCLPSNTNSGQTSCSFRKNGDRPARCIAR